MITKKYQFRVLLQGSRPLPSSESFRFNENSDVTSRYTRVWQSMTRTIMYTWPISSNPKHRHVKNGYESYDGVHTKEAANHDERPERSCQETLSFLRLLAILCALLWSRWWGSWHRGVPIRRFADTRCDLPLRPVSERRQLRGRHWT